MSLRAGASEHSLFEVAATILFVFVERARRRRGKTEVKTKAWAGRASEKEGGGAR